MPSQTDESEHNLVQKKRTESKNRVGGRRFQGCRWRPLDLDVYSRFKETYRIKESDAWPSDPWNSSETDIWTYVLVP